MQLTKVEIGLGSHRVFHGQGAEPLCWLLKLLLVFQFLTIIKVHASQVKHTFMVAFVCGLLEELDGLVEISLNTMTKLVANSKIIQRACAPFLWSFLEPFRSLLVIIQFVVEDATESVHW